MLRYGYFACIVKQKHSLCLITICTPIRLEQITSSSVQQETKNICANKNVYSQILWDTSIGHESLSPR